MDIGKLNYQIFLSKFCPLIHTHRITVYSISFSAMILKKCFLALDIWETNLEIISYSYTNFQEKTYDEHFSPTEEDGVFLMPTVFLSGGKYKKVCFF